MQIGKILFPVTTLGPGKRVGIWVLGCRRNCKGCSNPELQLFDETKDVPVGDVIGFVRTLDCEGATISGGEPFLQAEALADLLSRVRASRPEMTVIVYTGYTFAELQAMEGAGKLIALSDIIIDGRYIDRLNDNRGIRGSGNQRVIAVTGRLDAYVPEMESGVRKQQMVANPDGTFYGPFDPGQGADFETAPGFHEGSAWNYTFYVPHDIKGLAKLMGGADKFVEKLQMVFDTGLYDPANEPDIAYPYLFSYFKGEEWRTQELVAALVEEHYSDTPGGIPGNDDTGAMSAWAVFSMMGLYPDCPGSPYYVFTTPVFDRIEITLDPDFHGRDCLIIEKDPDTSGKYIDAVYSGGKRFKGFRISHEELLEGGHVVFGLTDEK